MRPDTEDRIRTIRPTPLPTLTLIELRKLVDTPSGVALVITAALLAGVFGGGQVLFNDRVGLDNIATLAGAPAGTLVPVLAVLLVTAERSHRTALVSYALVPRRGRVITAKALSAAALATAITPLTLLAAVIIAPVGQLITGHVIDWTVDPSRMAVFTATNVMLALSAVALGLAIGNAPAAIVIILTWPMVASLLSVRLEIANVVGWIDLGSVGVLQDSLAAADIGRAVVATGCWVLVPMLIGTRRILVEEVR